MKTIRHGILKTRKKCKSERNITSRSSETTEKNLKNLYPGYQFKEKKKKTK